MSEALRFYRDERFNAPSYEARDGSFAALGSLMTGDLGSSSFAVLLLLDGVELVRQGRSARDEWLGNGWEGEILPDGMHLQDLHTDDWRGDYSLDVVRDVTLDYLRFLLPDPEQRAAAVAAWEAAEGRPHPARADL